MEILSKRFDELSLHELYEILKARAEVFVTEQNIVYLDMDGIDMHSIHLFIKDGDTVCAYLRIIDPGVKYSEASIGRVLTLKPYRRRGYSRRLMEEALRITDSRNLPVKIEAQAYLEDFYKSLGFKTISEPFVLESLLHVEMVRE